MKRLVVLSKATCAVALTICLGCSNETTNPNESHPPVPSNPQPASGATRIGIYSSISWECSDPQGGQLTYDLYLGTNPHPPLYRTRVSQNSYSFFELGYDSVYYWKVVAVDEAYNATSGPIWNFRTATQSDQPPGAPYSPSPSDGSSALRPADVTLAWWCYNPSGAPLTFNVYFGTASQPPLVSSGQEQQQYGAGQLADSVTYYWRVEATANQVTTSGPIWSFTTGTSINQPPYQPIITAPGDSAIDVRVTSSLDWSGGDPDNDPVTYKLYFGTANPPPFVGNQFNSAYTPPDTLQYGTIYYWKVVSMDNQGHETSGAVWTFTTRPGNVQQVGSYDIGGSDPISFQGNYAYVGEYNAMSVVDISNPMAIHEAGQCPISNDTYAIFAAGSYVYLACGDSTLKIVDITNPANPTLVSEYYLGVNARRLYVSNGYAYVAYYSTGLKIVDVSDPLHPAESAQLSSFYAFDLIVSGNYIYAIGGSDGLQIIDISDPSNPFLSGVFNVSNSASLSLHGNYIYLAMANSGLQVVDISNPMNPSSAGALMIDPETSIFVSGNYAYLGSYYYGLAIVDISDLDHLHLAGSLATRSNDGYANRLYVSGNYIYMMAYGSYDLLALQFTL
jgi:hypothetical protein